MKKNSQSATAVAARKPTTPTKAVSQTGAHCARKMAPNEMTATTMYQPKNPTEEAMPSQSTMMIAAPSKDQNRERTAAFAKYSLIGALATAAGSLAAAAPDLLGAVGIGKLAALKILFYSYAALGVLHELFHVWQPFRPKGDGRWISEGLAEYYSLALQHRAGRLSDRSFDRGIRLFARYGRWGVDLSRTRHPAALNNSAPLIMWWIDREMRRVTGGRRTLDDAVRALASEHARLSTVIARNHGTVQ